VSTLEQTGLTWVAMLICDPCDNCATPPGYVTRTHRQCFFPDTRVASGRRQFPPFASIQGRTNRGMLIAVCQVVGAHATPD
jgi:hypothetical protein